MKTQAISDKGPYAHTGLAGSPGMTVATSMAPDPATTAGDEETSVPGSHIYEHLGFLIIEGRSPAMSTAKGRREGAHCPLVAAAAAATAGGGGGGSCRPYRYHQCRDSSDECTRAKSYRKEMATMWCNGIPLCVEALLCIACELDDSGQRGSSSCSCRLDQPAAAGSSGSSSLLTLTPAVACSAGSAATHCPCRRCTDVVAAVAVDEGGSCGGGGVRSGAYLLLEQWTIAVQPERRGHGPSSTAAGCVQPMMTAGPGGTVPPQQQQQIVHACSLADLVQAVKSHLFFSQLSAWLQMSQGYRPRHVVYRLTAPGEWFRHSFVSEPVSHDFPVAAVGKRHVVKVSLASLARTERSAAELCAEAARLRYCQRCSAAASHAAKVGGSATGCGFAGRPQQPLVPRRCSSAAAAAATAVENEQQPPPSEPWQDSLPRAAVSPPLDAGQPPLSPPVLHQRDGFLMRRHQRSLSGLNKLSAAAASLELTLSGSAFVSPSSSSSSSAAWQSSAVYVPAASSLQQQQQPCGGLPPASSAALERMGAFGEAGPRSVNELKLIGCSVGGAGHVHPSSPQFPVGSRSCQSFCNPGRWDKEPASAQAALGGLGVGYAVPPKSPKVLFSSWIKDTRKLSSPGDASHDGCLPQRAGTSDPDLGVDSCGSSSSVGSSRSGSSCRMRLSFDDESCDDDCYNDNGGGLSSNLSRQLSELEGRAFKDGVTTGELSVQSNKSSSLDRHGEGVTDKRRLLPPGDGGDRQCCSGASEAEAARGTGRLPTFDLGAAEPCVTTDAAYSRDSGRRREPVQMSAARLCGESAAEASRMKRSGESFPTFSKLRLNDRPTFTSQSSPAPVKKLDRRSGFHFDAELAAGGPKAIKSALSCGSLVSHCAGRAAGEPQGAAEPSLSTSAPAAASLSLLPPMTPSAAINAIPSTACTPSSALLGNFEETVLNGRMEPAGVVEGFSVDLGASGSFCPQHAQLPVKAYFFGSLSDDNAPSPYLGYVDLQSLGKRGYHVPRKGTLQVTLFNPNKKVVKMFVVLYDLEDMPPRSQTFLRQRTVYAPTGRSSCDASLPTHLRYLIHMRFATSKSGKLYLHTDLRLIFARDKFEYDARAAASYEMRSYTEAPSNPKFSPFS